MLQYRHLGTLRTFRPNRCRVEGTTLHLPLDLPWPDDDDPGWSAPVPVCRVAVRAAAPPPRPHGPSPPADPAARARRPDPRTLLKRHR